MVGFPGEDEAAFGRLLDFVREQRFERMGAFAYCEEEGTYGARNFADDIPDDVKKDLGHFVIDKTSHAIKIVLYVLVKHISSLLQRPTGQNPRSR